MFEPPVDPNSKARLIAINLDQASIGRANPNIEHERKVAIFDILESNRFELEGRVERREGKAPRLNGCLGREPAEEHR